MSKSLSALLGIVALVLLVAANLGDEHVPVASILGAEERRDPSMPPPLVTDVGMEHRLAKARVSKTQFQV